jgi:ankyrin repeat protein
MEEQALVAKAQLMTDDQLLRDLVHLGALTSTSLFQRHLKADLEAMWTKAIAKRRDDPLFWAAGAGDVSAVKALLQANGSLSVINKPNMRSGHTALHEAAWHGHVEVVDVLLRAGANVIAQNQDGRLPLHEAASEGHVGVIEKLLVGSKGPLIVDARDSQGCTPLHVASRKGQVKAVMCLLSHRARVDCADLELRTPLHDACSEGHVDVVKALLRINVESGVADDSFPAIERLAMANSLDADDQTPLHCAVTGGHVDVVRVLIASGVKV